MAWDAVARTPRCMLWLDITDDGILFSCLMSLLTPTRNSPFSPLPYFQSIKSRNRRGYKIEDEEWNSRKNNRVAPTYLRKINASPATSLLELTNTLHPVVSRCRLGCPACNILDWYSGNIKSERKSAWLDKWSFSCSSHSWKSTRLHPLMPSNHLNKKQGTIVWLRIYISVLQKPWTGFQDQCSRHLWSDLCQHSQLIS